MIFCHFLRKSNMNCITAESVTKRHPDKICDQISDAILDACLEQDPMSRVAVETIGGHNTIVLIGEVTTKAVVDFSSVARSLYNDLIGKDIGVLCNIVKQSPQISQGVDIGGAGDQGCMVGYACAENPERIPEELNLARKLLQPYDWDGKSQVTIENGVVSQVVLSVQNQIQSELEKWVRTFFKGYQNFDYNVYCNNTGAFTVGGFDADSGVTGRKIVVDAYGPRVPVGGGAFSGKDPTKVDRSAAYMARWIALKRLKESGAKEVTVRLAYVIGRAEPVMMTATYNGIEYPLDNKEFDCRPEAIIERFDLRKPIYLQTAANGHFGYKDYPWEKI
jgi:S-adenosylmethionine synthetase